MTSKSINESLPMSRKELKEEALSRKYANFFFDFTFKRVFGNEKNKDIVISFLNALLPNKKIKDVMYNATEKVAIHQKARNSYLTCFVHLKTRRNLS